MHLFSKLIQIKIYGKDYTSPGNEDFDLPFEYDLNKSKVQKEIFNYFNSKKTMNAKI